MRFRCSECGALHEIPDDRLGKGKRVRCQRCQAITVVRPGDSDPDPPTQPSTKVPDLDHSPDSEPDMEAPTRIASIEDVLAADRDAEMDETTRVASVDEIMAADAAGGAAAAGPDDDDDGVVAYDAVDWEQRPTVEANTAGGEAVPVQPLAAEVPQDSETITAGCSPETDPSFHPL